MYYLIYISYAVEPFSPEQLEDLLKKCVKKNTALGITGMLLYVDGKFIQVLEGKEEVIKSVYEKIQKDQRHRKVKVIIDGIISKRNFPDWAMGFKSLNDSELNQMTGYTNIDKYFNEEKVNDNSHIALVFLKLFYEKNRRPS